MAYDIFISYRRDGGALMARTLCAELELLGYRVFLDFNELKDGVFDKRIMDAIDEAPIFITLLTPHSLDRCVNEDDWVRREIEYAIEKNRHLVPINPDREFSAFPSELPEHLKAGLGQHQFSEIMFGQLLKSSLREMVENRIRPIIGEVARDMAQRGVGALVHIETDLDCRIYRFGKELGVAAVGEDIPIRLMKGRHKMKFVSITDERDTVSDVIEIPENDYEDMYEVKLLEVQQARIEKEEAEKRAVEEAERKRQEEARKRKEAERRRKEAEKETERKRQEEARLAEERRKEEEHKRQEEARRRKEEARRRKEEERKRKEEADIAAGKGRNGIYEIGFYYDDGNKQGVVFEVSANGRHGKIVSLTESSVPLVWCYGKSKVGSFLGLFDKKMSDVEIGASSHSDGAFNMKVVKGIEDWRDQFPVFAWCDQLGNGWYLPAIDELKKFTLDKAINTQVNETLESYGCETIYNGDYWSSTEYREIFAWGVLMSSGNASYNIKFCLDSVRAVSVF